MLINSEYENILWTILKQNKSKNKKQDNAETLDESWEYVVQKCCFHWLGSSFQGGAPFEEQ